MPIGRPRDIRPSYITPHAAYLSRRELIAGTAAVGVATALPAPGSAAKRPAATSSRSTDEPLTTYKNVTTYNNFYEFGTDKDDPAKNAHTLKTQPWKVKVDGLVGKAGDYDLDDLYKAADLEERVY